MYRQSNQPAAKEQHLSRRKKKPHCFINSSPVIFNHKRYSYYLDSVGNQLLFHLGYLLTGGLADGFKIIIIVSTIPLKINLGLEGFLMYSSNICVCTTLGCVQSLYITSVTSSYTDGSIFNVFMQ